MEENFNPVARTRANYYTPGSPVQFVCVELLKGDVSGEHAVCLTFKNISKVTLTALEIHFKCKGVDGVILCEDRFEYRDLEVKPGELFGMDDAVFVTAKAITSVDVSLCNVYNGKRVVHLDGLYWQPGWVAMERAAWRRTVENEIAKDAWIIDGNFGSSLELRLSRAQAAVYLDYSRAVCLAGVLRRVWTTHGRVRPDMGAGCPERFDLSFLRWVWDFPKRDGTHVKALLAAHPEVRCVTLKNRRDAQVLLRRLEGADDGSI